MSDDRQRRLLGALTGLLPILGVVAVLSFLMLYERETVPSVPALEYQTVRVQEVLPSGFVRVPQVPNFDAPSVLVGESLPLEFSRCSDVPDFEAMASTWWVDEDGDRIAQAEAVPVMILTGCITTRVELQMPNRVAVENVGGFGDPEAIPQARVWHVVGEIDPVDPDIETAEWQTEPFLIVNPVPPLFPADDDSMVGG